MGEAEADAVVEIVSSFVIDVIEEMAVEAGPSQCLYRDVLLDVLVQCSAWEQTNGLRAAHSQLKQWAMVPGPGLGRWRTPTQ